MPQKFYPGQKVVYRAPHVTPDLPGEEGTVVSVMEDACFVRYGNDTIPKHTRKAFLRPMTAKEWK